MKRLSKLLGLLLALMLLAAACGGADPAGSGGDDAEDDATETETETEADAGDDAADDDEGDDAAGLGEITVWVMGEDERLQEMMAGYEADFEAANAGSDVIVEYIPWDGGKDRFINSITSGDVPDLAESASTWTPEFAAIGGLEAETDIDSDWVPSLVDAATVDGEVYGAPWYAGTRSFIYRTDIFDELGLEVPTTWEELEAAADTIKAETDIQYPLIVPGDYMHMLLPMVWQAGGEIAELQDGQWVSNINDEAGVLAFETYARWHSEYAAPETLNQNEAEAREGAFDNGDAAMMIGGAWDVTGAAAANPELEGKLGTAVIPAGPGGSWTFLGGSHLSVFADSDNSEGAHAFRDFILSAEQLTKFTDEFGFWAGTNAGINESALLQDPIMEAFGITVRDHTKVYPVTAAWGALETDPKPQTTAIQAIIQGADVQATLDTLKADIEAALNG
ncbi:MAG TPA: extracellular solute-binding protein [Egibacteraceae bacterium]|nr:extracellular solute-binding protein [Egibacteraceae bacterium]